MNPSDFSLSEVGDSFSKGDSLGESFVMKVATKKMKKRRIPKDSDGYTSPSEVSPDEDEDEEEGQVEPTEEVDPDLTISGMHSQVMTDSQMLGSDFIWRGSTVIDAKSEKKEHPPKPEKKSDDFEVPDRPSAKSAVSFEELSSKVSVQEEVIKEVRKDVSALLDRVKTLGKPTGPSPSVDSRGGQQIQERLKELELEMKKRDEMINNLMITVDALRDKSERLSQDAMRLDKELSRVASKVSTQEKTIERLKADAKEKDEKIEAQEKRIKELEGGALKKEPVKPAEHPVVVAVKPSKTVEPVVPVKPARSPRSSSPVKPASPVVVPVVPSSSAGNKSPRFTKMEQVVTSDFTLSEFSPDLLYEQTGLTQEEYHQLGIVSKRVEKAKVIDKNRK